MYFRLLRGFCQRDKGSAEADPSNYNGGSARMSKVLLAMIPKSVKQGSARVLLRMIPLKQPFPKEMVLPGCGSAKTQKPQFVLADNQTETQTACMGKF